MTIAIRAKELCEKIVRLESSVGAARDAKAIQTRIDDLEAWRNRLLAPAESLLALYEWTKRNFPALATSGTSATFDKLLAAVGQDLNALTEGDLFKQAASS